MPTATVSPDDAMSRTSDDLENELEAIRSIYGEHVLQASGINVFVLSVPQYRVSLRLFFPPEYPTTSPTILGTEAVLENTRKGYGKKIVDIAGQILQAVYQPGLVCLFDLLQELEAHLSHENEAETSSLHNQRGESVTHPPSPPLASSEPARQEIPDWFLSSPITEKKSTFVARACSVTSPAQARAFVAHLLATDKRASKATHNIIAYRIRSPASTGFTSDLSYQDCDDDGENAAGGRLLHLLQIMDVWGLLVVVSRWYGGVKLGPDRFSVINNVAREAIVGGGWAKDKVMKD